MPRLPRQAGAAVSGTTPPACERCGKALEYDEVAIYRKLVNRAAKRFLCIPCLAAYFQVPEGLIREKIAQLRQMGCTLF